jgi:creatinine amidohydrolase
MVLEFAAEEMPMTTRAHSAPLFVLLMILAASCPTQSQAITPPSKLSVHWEELTAADFREGIRRSQGTCLLPFGILEKHGPHLPLGTDLLDVRYAALHAAEQEYAVVFPEYYFGQIAEARHEPGTVAYSREMQLALLQETTDEMARNGCKKVIIVNGHGGNEHLLPFFAQSQLDKPHDYVVYVFDRRSPETGGPPKKTTIDMHAGESETSKMMISRPDTVHIDRANTESPRRCLHRNLVVRALPQSLFRRRVSGDKRVGKISDGLVDRRCSQVDSSHQSRRCQLKAAKRILRKEQTPARHTAVDEMRNAFVET